ncbi:hypothetical protein LJB93_01695 [Desulfovibrio sp. OttesenSCG-928-F07]|nr:hypothetical protein [Desulfovibrio sp. OttesenSCG-928-F07]
MLLYRAKRALTLAVLLPVICAIFFTGACSNNANIWIPESSLKIGIAPFTQPLTAADLFAGYIPENVNKIEAKVFPQLDEDFALLLSNTTKREYTSYQAIWKLASKTTKPANTSAFNYWVQIGTAMGVDLLVVPQIQQWQERTGSDFGAERPAAVVMDFFLLDIRNKSLVYRCRYDELQRPLLENLLELDKFIDRGGKWVTAQRLAQEGMYKAIKEFGL